MVRRTKDAKATALKLKEQARNTFEIQGGNSTQKSTMPIPAIVNQLPIGTNVPITTNQQPLLYLQPNQQLSQHSNLYQQQSLSQQQQFAPLPQQGYTSSQITQPIYPQGQVNYTSFVSNPNINVNQTTSFTPALPQQIGVNNVQNIKSLPPAATISRMSQVSSNSLISTNATMGVTKKVDKTITSNPTRPLSQFQPPPQQQQHQQLVKSIPYKSPAENEFGLESLSDAKDLLPEKLIDSKDIDDETRRTNQVLRSGFVTNMNITNNNEVIRGNDWQLINIMDKEGMCNCMKYVFKDANVSIDMNILELISKTIQSEIRISLDNAIKLSRRRQNRSAITLYKKLVRNIKEYTNKQNDNYLNDITMKWGPDVLSNVNQDNYNQLLLIRNNKIKLEEKILNECKELEDIKTKNSLKRKGAEDIELPLWIKEVNTFQ